MLSHVSSIGALKDQVEGVDICTLQYDPIMKGLDLAPHLFSSWRKRAEQPTMYFCIIKRVMLLIYLFFWPSFAAALNEQLPQLLILPPILDGRHGDAKTADHEFVGYLTPKSFSLNLLTRLSVFAPYFPPWNISESHSTQKT